MRLPQVWWTATAQRIMDAPSETPVTTRPAAPADASGIDVAGFGWTRLGHDRAIAEARRSARTWHVRYRVYRLPDPHGVVWAWAPVDLDTQ